MKSKKVTRITAIEYRGDGWARFSFDPISRGRNYPEFSHQAYPEEQPKALGLQVGDYIHIGPRLEIVAFEIRATAGRGAL